MYIGKTPDGKTFEQRQMDYIQHVLWNPAPKNAKQVFNELVRMAGGSRAHKGILYSVMEDIDARWDCSDFVLHGILRLLCQFDETRREQRFRLSVTAVKHRPSHAVLERAKRTPLNFNKPNAVFNNVVALKV